MDGTRIELESCTVDLDALCAEREGVRTPLTVHERDLLRALIDREGEPMDRATLLAEVWRYAPTVVSRAVDVTVRRLRQKIELDPGNPRHLLTARGVGYRFVLGAVAEQIPHSDVSVDVPEGPPLLLLTRRRTPGLARRGHSGPLFGRDADKRAILEWWATGGRARLLLGAPGVGTTSLVAWLARSVEPLWWCELARKADREGALRAISERVGIPVVRQPSEAALIERVAEAAASADRPLMVLDGLEPGVDLADAIRAWLDAAPGLGIAITAHHRPHLFEGAVLHPVEPIDADSALAMLEHHLGPERASPELADRAQGLPGRLMELVANVTLVGPLPTGIPLPTSRYQPAFERALERASEPARTLLAQLAVFPDRFDLRGSARVHPDPALLERIQELREHGLLAAPSPGRFRILDPIRRLLPPPDPQSWRRYAELTLERGPSAEDQALAQLTADRVGPELALAAAIERARRHEDELVELDALIEASAEPWRSRGLLLRAARAPNLEAALADLDRVTLPEGALLRCQRLTDAGELERALVLPDVPELQRIRALRLAERDELRDRTLAIAGERRAAGDYAGEAHALTEAAWWALDLGLPDEAERLALEAQAASRLCVDSLAARRPIAVRAAAALVRGAPIHPDLELPTSDGAWIDGLQAWIEGDPKRARAAWDRVLSTPLERWTADLARGYLDAATGDPGSALRAVRPVPPAVPGLHRVRAHLRAHLLGEPCSPPARPWWAPILSGGLRA